MTYTPPTITGYNSSPPPDDGSATTANKILWSTIKGKLSDPIKNFVDSINTAVDTAFEGLFLSTISTKSSTFTVGAGEDGTLFNCTATLTANLPPAASAGEGFHIMVLNSSSGTITIDPDGSETVNGSATITSVNQYEGVILVCTGSAWLAARCDGDSVTRTNMTATGTLAVNGSSTLTGIATCSAALNTAKGADIASATTTDIGAATGNFVHITGTTTITGLGTITAGVIRVVRFAGVLTLTHNATSLILPTGANITTTAGDTAIFISEGSGNWRCVNYEYAADRPYALTLMTPVSASSTSVNFTGIPSWVKRITIISSGLSGVATGQFAAQLGTVSGAETSGYNGSCFSQHNFLTLSSQITFTATDLGTSASQHTTIILTKLSNSANTWLFMGMTGTTTGDAVNSVSGSKTLSGQLDRVIVKTANGTDTFDAGTINVMYE